MSKLYVEPIYKVFIFDNEGNTSKIIIFNGDSESDPHDLIKEFFTSEELESINPDSVHWSSFKIHPDDSIKTIKEKVLYELNNQKKHKNVSDNSFFNSLDHIYLFANTDISVNLVEIYQEISQNEKKPISKEMFAQILSNFNIKPEKYMNMDVKEFYEYEDFVSVFGNGEFKEIPTPLGFHFTHQPADYTFIANPYLIIDTTSTHYTPKSARNPIKYDENRTLLKHGNFTNIYCCIYENVVDYSFKNGIEADYIAEVYFPILAEKGIVQQEPPLKTPSVNITLDKWRTVDSFYQLYHRVNGIEANNMVPYKIPYISRGIQKIAFILFSSAGERANGTPLNFPLESIFKNVHASATIPFISFNPRIKKEVILRLYTNQISKNGKKIPFLKEADIAKISREFKTSKTISFYAIAEGGGTGVAPIEIYLELWQTGEIHVRSSHPTPLSIQQWNSIFQRKIATVLDGINSVLRQSGYPLFEFNGLDDEKLIKIESIKYIENVRLPKNISLSDVNGLSEIFTIIGNKDGNAGDKEDFSKGVILRFRRVDNFKENDEQTILITELFKKTRDTDAILAILSESFGMSEIDAKGRLAKFITEHNYELDDIRDSAGFPTVFQLNRQVSLNNSLVITVDEIDSLKYLDILHIYIDCILQINLNPSLKPGDLFGKKGWTLQLNNPKGFFVNQDVINRVIVKPVGEEEQKGVKTAIKPIEFSEEDEYFSEEEEEQEEQEEQEDGDGDNFIDLDKIEQIENKIPPPTFDTNPPVNDDQDENDDIIILEEDLEYPTENNTPPLVENHESHAKVIDTKTDNIEIEIKPKSNSEPQKEESSESDEEEDNDTRHKPQKGESSEDLIYLSESDEEEDNDTRHKPQKGGILTDVNLDGQPISFLDRLQSREPTLFLSKKNGKFDTYSRMCESNLKRQPVILTDEEKQEIDTNHPNSYSQSIKYGTGDDKYWYICPRFWCLKTNTSMTEKEVKSGVCGGIIPKDATKIPTGSYVYEFNSSTKQHLDAKGNYIDNVPGFLRADSHPDGKCIPCCFKGSWDKPQQRKRREECAQKTPAASSEKAVTTQQLSANSPAAFPVMPPPPSAAPKKGDVFYVFSSFAYPIQQHRFGFLPVSVQKLFQMDVSKLVIKTNPANIQPNKPCLVRYGVENSNTQSFLACFAEIYAYKQELDTPPTITQMKNILIESITIDDFIGYHNGSLIGVFGGGGGEKNIPSISDPIPVDVFISFKTTKLWTRTFGEKEPTDKNITNFLEKNTAGDDPLFHKLTLFHSVLISYRNFLSYLNDPNIEIDHTFLWDALTDNNPRLMKGGVNLIVIQIPNDDLTDNVEIICPTVSMSNKSFDFANRETVVFIKQELFYEPIYLYEERDKMIRVTKTFLEKSSVKPVIQTIQKIRAISKKYCSSQPSRPKVYHFKRNRELDEVDSILKKHDYKIHTQLSNYRGKIIGVYIAHRRQSPEEGVFIPIYPSSALPDIPVKFIDNEDIYNNYETTIQRLRNIKKNTGGLILTEPRLKVLEDGLVVGILTETNQFIQLSSPETVENTAAIDGATPLEITAESNYLMADKTLNTYEAGDPERENTIRQISLENKFYLMFRSIARISLAKYENRTTYLGKIQEIIDTESMLYKEKLRALIDILKEMLADAIDFKEMDAKTLENIGVVGKGDEKCAIASINGKCSLLLPKNNLISGFDNEAMYYAKLADEMVRYTRIRLFMFQPKYFLSVPNEPYSINNDEFLVLQSLLTHEYFKDIRVYNVAPQIRNTEYEFVEPVQNELYSNKVGREELETEGQLTGNGNLKDVVEDHSHICISEIRPVAGNWAREFAGNPKTKEIVFKNTVICSYSPIIYILQRRIEGTGEISVQLVRKILWNGYSKYLSKYGNQIQHILKKEGKIDLMDRVNKGVVSFEAVVYSEDYYLTNLDYWIISTETQIPIILFNSTTLKNMVEGVDWLFLGGGEIHDYIYYVRSPALLEKNTPPKYSIIVPSFKFTELKEMKYRIQGVIEGREEFKRNAISLIEYLENSVNQMTKKKRVVIV